MKTYKIQDREAGNVIETGLSEKKAKQRIMQYEKNDKKDGVYIAEFYEIKEEEEEQDLIFTNETDRLECFESDLYKKHNWTGKYGINFNGKFEFFKTLKGLNNRIEFLVNKHNLILNT